MRTIKWTLSIGYPTAVVEDELEVEDDTTDEEIEEIINELANNYISIDWEE